MMTISMNLIDPDPVFNVTAFLKSNTLKTVHLRDKLYYKTLISSVSNGTTFSDVD